MTKKKLAHELRQKQIKLGLVPKHIIMKLSDDEIIESCIIHPNSGPQYFNEEELHESIALAEDAEHFLNISPRIFRI